MNPERTKQHASRPGFTLIELMLVIAIIAVLASLTIGGVRYYDEKTKYSRTEVLIKSIESALEEYKRDNGFYPQGDGASGSTEQVYIALYGDGKLSINAAGVVSIVNAPDGDNADTTDGTMYLATLNPELTGTKGNVELQGGRYVIVDSWSNEMANSSRNQLRYRHNPQDPLVVNDMMNPVSDYDLWSKGPDGKGPPDSTAQADTADDIKNW